MGRVVWAPPEFLIERLKEFRERMLRLTFSLLLGGVVVAAAGILSVQAGFDVGWGVGTLGFLLVLGSVWPWTRATAASTVWFAVLERGVVMPASFTNVPGLTKLGGPCALPRSQIESAKQLREPGGRAVMVMTGEGMGGLVAGRVGPVELSREEQEKVLDDFLTALRGIGVRIKAETVAQGEGAADGETTPEA